MDELHQLKKRVLDLEAKQKKLENERVGEQRNHEKQLTLLRFDDGAPASFTEVYTDSGGDTVSAMKRPNYLGVIQIEGRRFIIPLYNA